MTRPTLERPSKDPAVEDLQRLLNRVGALLEVDGDFGPATERAVRDAQAEAGLPETGIADQATWDWLEARPEPSPDLPTEAVTFIVREEVGSRAFYERHTAMPHFPGVDSGVTIGIGYDLRFQAPEDFERDWALELTAEQMDLLRPHLGRKGSQEAVNALMAIRIPFRSALRVFCKASLPRAVEDTRRTYTGFDSLPPLCRGALVSLVYNRGAKLDGERRREMAAIKEHIENGEFDRVAAEFEAMKRLWPNAEGLRTRRDKEADLWRKGFESA